LGFNQRVLAENNSFDYICCLNQKADFYRSSCVLQRKEIKNRNWIHSDVSSELFDIYMFGPPEVDCFRQAWSRLVRFIANDDREYCGQPEDPEIDGLLDSLS
jgi:hypothetical protein